jgi:hypothetical protein
MFLNFHDLVKIEVINEPNKIREFLQREFHVFMTDEAESPDIKIEFMDKIQGSHHIEFIGDTAAYDEKSFYVIDQNRNKASVPFDKLGNNKCNIQCETEMSLDTLFYFILEPALHYYMLPKKATLIHSSATCLNRVGILFPAWGGTGKTDILLNFLKNGASYMSDDWTIITEKGQMLAYPRTINIFDYNIDNFPELRYCIPNKVFHRKLFLNRAFTGFHQFLQNITRTRSYEPLQIITNCVGEFLECNTRVPYDTLFPNASIQMICSIGKVFFLTRSNTLKVKINEESPQRLAQKMIPCLMYERRYFLNLYRMFQFAFPARKNKLIDKDEVSREIILKALEDKETYHVQIPKRATPKELYNTICEYIDN